MVRIGSYIKITSENEGYDKYRGRAWKVSHIARNKHEHPYYDEGVGGLLVSADGLPFSLYEWEFEEVDSPRSKKSKGWHENPDHTGKAPEHHRVACKALARTANNKPMGRMSSEPEWYQDAETNTYKVWKTHYKGFWATVYHVGKETTSDTEGWEYELYREKPHAEYNSLYESSTGGDHAKDAETAMQWAINTINEWGK